MALSSVSGLTVAPPTTGRNCSITTPIPRNRPQHTAAARVVWGGSGRGDFCVRAAAVEKLGIVVERNPDETKLSRLGVNQWPKRYASTCVPRSHATNYRFPSIHYPFFLSHHHLPASVSPILASMTAAALPSPYTSLNGLQFEDRSGAKKLGLPGPDRSIFVVGKSEARAGGDGGGGGGGGSVKLVYSLTSADRELRTPHSGYHFDGSARQFFEGWYFKVSIPEVKQSFCFMYSVENPAFTRKLISLEEAQYGRKFTGVGAQILGADDKYICQYSDESRNFWGSRNELILGNSFATQNKLQPPNKEIPPEKFDKRVVEGFQVTPLWHQGFIQDDGRSNYVETVTTARWQYSTSPIYGWGNVGAKQKSTAGWLATFPVFEPHWQVCMAGGLSTGWIEWDDQRFEFQNAPSYSEKNWGGAFPRKWFWVQCNVFEGARGEVALTAAGGLRQLPGGIFEDAALIGIHHAGIFYEFVPWNGVVEWDVAPWGSWQMVADNGSYKVELEAITDDPGTTLRAPTLEAGLAPACKDTCYGILKLRMWVRMSDGSKGKVILDVTSEMAAVEVGGGPWFSNWKGKTTTPEILSRALRVPVDVEALFGLVPFLKPPGL